MNNAFPGVRPSLHPISRFCPGAADLCEKGGVGRMAEMSSVMHGMWANVPGSLQRWAALTESEREELKDWKKPLDTTIKIGESLRGLCYDQAIKEQTLAVDDMGFGCEPNTPDVFFQGTPDFVFVLEQGGMRYGIVQDIKASEYTTHGQGADTDQLLAYCFLVALHHSCDVVIPSLYIPKEAEYWFSDTWIHFGDPKVAADVWSRVEYNARNNQPGRYVTGAHCDHCYGALRCPEYLLPAALAETELAAFCDDQEPTAEDVAKAVLRAKAMAKLADKAIDIAKQHARRLPVVYEGKQFKALPRKNPGGLDRERLEADLGEAFAKYKKPDTMGEQFRWVNLK